MSIVCAVMVPHPPVIIPEVGKGEEQKITATASAYEEAMAFIKSYDPETVIVLSPHSIMYADYFHVSPGAKAEGHLEPFGAKEVSLQVEYDEKFAEQIEELANLSDVRAGIQGEMTPPLDHGTLIPLLYLAKAYGEAPLPKVLRVGLSGLPLTQHYRFGMLIKEVAEQQGKRVAIIASGDLSHRLKEDGPYGFAPEGPQYDAQIMDVMGCGDFGRLFGFREQFCDAAGECGHRAFTILAGALDGCSVDARKLSYEGTFGVGYGVCTFAVGEAAADRHFLAAEKERQTKELEERLAKEDAYIRLARASLETWVRHRRLLALPEDAPEEFRSMRKGVFVSLHEGGMLRGCIGTIEATEENLGLEIMENAIRAGSRDPRFAPVTAEELPMLEYHVDVLEAAEPISSLAELDVKRYGVIVSCGEKRGLLLPDLEGIETPEQQVAIAKQKAGIMPGEEVVLERFEVIRHS